MKENIQICYRGSSAEIVEKKSRFIANVKEVKTEAEAISFIENIRKKYYDARHNCYAYVLGNFKETKQYKYSDDGEPANTAGKPMLDVLLNENITNVCAVVTRYFGGTLLGTGGLIRAYQGALKEALKTSEILSLYEGEIFTLSFDYSLFGKLKYFIEEKKYFIIDTNYGLNVKIKVLVNIEEIDTFLNSLSNIFLLDEFYDERESVSYLIYKEKAIIVR